MGAMVAARGMAWLHLPIVDVDIPRAPFVAAWVTAGPRLHGWLREGRRILLHCKGGLGRTGTIAATLLIEQGTAPAAAILAVRAARDGTIETPAQLAWVRALVPAWLRGGCMDPGGSESAARGQPLERRAESSVRHVALACRLQSRISRPPRQFRRPFGDLL